MRCMHLLEFRSCHLLELSQLSLVRMKFKTTALVRKKFKTVSLVRIGFSDYCHLLESVFQITVTC